MLNDKDWDGIVDSLMTSVKSWRIAQIRNSSRAMSEQDMLEVLYNKGLNGLPFETIESAFFDAIRMSCKDDIVLVIGSFHTVADVLRIIQNEVEKA